MLDLPGPEEFVERCRDELEGAGYRVEGKLRMARRRRPISWFPRVGKSGRDLNQPPRCCYRLMACAYSLSLPCQCISHPRYRVAASYTGAATCEKFAAT